MEKWYIYYKKKQKKNKNSYDWQESDIFIKKNNKKSYYWQVMLKR